MSGDAPILSERAAELRRAFDQAFSEPVRAETRETIDFISLRLGGDPYAIRMAEIAGLFADVKITPCPSPLAELRGIAGFRGTLTPVYDLGALLGYPPSSGRWMVLAAGRTPALAFDAFDEHFRVEPSAIAAQPPSSGPRHVHEITRLAGRAWPVIDIPSLVAVIAARAAATATSSRKEH